MKAPWILLFLAGAAHAEFKDGNKLLSQIRGDSHDYVNAVGYVTGVADALRSVIHCPPENVTAGQIVDMVKRHLENSPELRHMTGDAHISFVLRRAWPCATEQKKSGRGV